MREWPELKTGACAQYPLTRKVRWMVCTLQFVDGSEQRFLEAARPERTWVLPLEALEEEELLRVEESLGLLQGRLGKIDFTDPVTKKSYTCNLAKDIVEVTWEEVGRGRAEIELKGS